MGGRHSNIFILESISMCEEIAGKKINTQYVEQNRVGDHIWWISDVSKFKSHYPDWNYQYSSREILEEIYDMKKNVVV